jgi:hypothetical protein
MTTMLKDNKFIAPVDFFKISQKMPGIPSDHRGLVLHQPCVYANAYHGT